MGIHTENYIMTIDNFCTDETCDTLIDICDNFSIATRTSNTLTRNDTTWSGVDALKLYTFSGEPHNRPPLGFYKKLTEALLIYSEAFPQVEELCLGNLDTVSYFNFNIQRTLPGGGFHSWHFEASLGFPNRFLVWSLNLNDIEEGGELEFKDWSQRIKPKKGSMTLFPAFYTHLHRGNPPLKEEKWIATGWYESIPQTQFMKEFLNANV